MLKKLTRREFMVLSSASLSALALSGCNPGATTPTTPSPQVQRGGKLRIGVTDMASTDLTPWVSISSGNSILKLAIYETLVRYDSQFKIEPALATSWESSPDGLTWTFKLRPGVKFHDGSVMTAADVTYSFGELLNPDNGYLSSVTFPFIDKVEAVDDNTVKFTLNSVNQDFLIILADSLGAAYVVPHTKTVEELIEKPIGTGPFKLADYLPSNYVSFVRHEAYWETGLPYLDELRHLYIPEMATQIAALSSGELDMMWLVDTASIAPVQQLPHIKLVEMSPHCAYQPIVMSSRQKPFDDVRVRQAMKYLVDRSAYLQMVYQGRGRVGNDQPLVPDAPFFDVGITPFEFSLEKAKALLAEAGYPNGFETTLATSNAFPDMSQSAIVYQEMAKKAGITIRIEQLPVDNYWSEYLNYPMAVSSLGLFPSTDQLLTMAFRSTGAWNETGIQDEALDALIDAARAETDTGKRQALYTQIQQKIQLEGGIVVPCFRAGYYAVHENVQGLIYSPNTITRANTTWIKPS